MKNSYTGTVGRELGVAKSLIQRHCGRGRGGADLPILHRAEWVVPVAYPPIQDGAVLVQGSRILAVGPYPQVKSVSPSQTKEVDHGSSAILPGLVNAHTHLELSGLHRQIDLPKESFAQWLKELLALRPSMTQEFLEQGLEHGRQQLVAGGCCLCGDITNGSCLKTDANCDGDSPANDEDRSPGARNSTERSPLSMQHRTRNTQRGTGSTQHATGNTQHAYPTDQSPLMSQIFLEVVGFDRERLADAVEPDLDRATLMETSTGLPLSLAAHSCYATSGAVISAAKEWSRTRGLPFSIHVAEHLDEIEFLQQGTGFCREVLEKLARWVPCWIPPEATPMRYLEQLKVLDSKTLLVHAVHLREVDWEIVIRNHCPVCFCPRSNRNLNAGRPDIAKALRHGVVTALGTDSLASNTDLNLFSEAAHILDHYSNVPPEAIILMMTLGGARALGQERGFGSIEPGKRASLLAVSLPVSFLSHQLFEMLIHQGNEGAFQWAHHPVTPRRDYD